MREVDAMNKVTVCIKNFRDSWMIMFTGCCIKIRILNIMLKMNYLIIWIFSVNPPAPTYLTPSTP